MYTTYILVLQKKTSSAVPFRKETICMERGFYLYVGSARRHMQARLARHLMKQKTLFWHVDYVTSCPDVMVRAIFLSSRRECATLREVSALGAPFGRRLGASDCTCPSHFIHVPAARLKNVMSLLAHKGYIAVSNEEFGLNV